MKTVLTPQDFKKNYDEIFEGNEIWKNLEIPQNIIYEWEDDSTYIKEIPFFKDISEQPKALRDIDGAKVLLALGDSITTDHISPAGSFSESSEAGKYRSEEHTSELQSRGHLVCRRL